MKVNSYILLEFKGRLNGPLLDQLLASLQWNLEETQPSIALRKRVFSVAMECFQNVYRYSPQLTHSMEGDVSDENAYVEAWLSVRFEQGQYKISSGNAVFCEHVPALRKALDDVNNATPDLLKAKYNEALLNYSTSNQRGAGLGLLDMKRKSANRLVYSIKQDVDTCWFDLELQLS